jgi:hypothetical protein
MARKTAEEGGDAAVAAAAAAADQQTRDAAAGAAAQAAALRQAQQGGSATVLSSGPIPEVKLGPAAGAPPVRTQGDEVDVDVAARQLLDPATTAPVVADATKRAPYKRAGAEAARAPAADGEEGEAPAGPKPAKWFAVLETRTVLDRVGGHRTPLRAGKIISDQQYDIAFLLRQGAKLKKVDAPTSAATDDALIDALTQ